MGEKLCRTLGKRKRNLKKNDEKKTDKFKVSAKKKRKKNIRRILYLVIIFVAMVGVTFFTPLFNIQGVNVKGAFYTKESQIYDALKVEVGENWYKTIGMNPSDWVRFTYSDAQNNLMINFPYIKNAVVSYRPLGNVTVKIKEREPSFLVLVDGKYLVLDKQGFYLDVLEPIERPKLPVLENLTIENLNLGDRIDFQEPYVLENLASFIQIKDSIGTKDTKNVLEYITALDFSELDFFSLTLEDRIRVVFADIEDITQYRINFLEEIYFQKLSKEERGVLDFTLGDTREVLFQNKK